MSNPIWGPTGSLVADKSSGFVAAQFNNSQYYASNAYSTLTDLLKELMKPLPPINAGPDVALDENAFNPDQVAMNVPQVPDLPTFTQLPPAPPDVPTITVGAMPTLPVDDLVVPVDAFAYSESRYTSNLLDADRAWLLDEVVNGGTGLTAQSQSDIYTMETERNLQAMADAMDRAANTWATSGWSLPDGVLEASLFALNLDYMQRQLDKSRDIRVEAEKIAIQQKQFAITQANVIEGTLITYENQISQRAFETAKAEMDYVLAFFDAALKDFQARIELAKVAIDFVLQVAKVETEIALAIISIYTAEIAAYKAQADVVIAYMDALVRRYSAEGQVDEAVARTQLGNQEIGIKTFEARINEAKAKADVLLKNLDIKLQELVDIDQLRIKAAEAGATIASHVVAGALAAAHAQAHVGYSSSDSASSSNSHSSSNSSIWSEES
jgi:hypothetical protein